MNSVFRILDNQLHLHESMDSLQEGWAYCNCHPETCCHEDGVYYKGKEEPFKLEGYYLERYENHLNDRTYQTQEEVERLLNRFGVKYKVDYNKKIAVPGVDIHGSRVQIEEYKEIYFYRVEHVINAILQYQSKQRKDAWDNFQNML